MSDKKKPTSHSEQIRQASDELRNALLDFEQVAPTPKKPIEGSAGAQTPPPNTPGNITTPEILEKIRAQLDKLS